MRSGKTLTTASHAAHSCVGRRKPLICVGIFDLFFSFVFCVSRACLCYFRYRDVFTLDVFTVDGSLLFRFCCCSQIDGCHGTWGTRRATAVSACAEVRVLRSLTFRYAIFMTTPATPNRYCTLLNTTYWPPGRVCCCCTARLDVLQRILVCTRWPVWLLTPDGDALLPSTC